jgi:hypothetical protein
LSPVLVVCHQFELLATDASLENPDYQLFEKGWEMDSFSHPRARP